MQPKQPLPMPTVDNVRAAIELFNKENESVEETIQFMVHKWPANTEHFDVLAKVKVINVLYSTQIHAVLTVAENIVSAAIDQDLGEGQASVIDRVAWITLRNGDRRRNYSFATKYCSFHNPEQYPIYDRSVDLCLRAYQGQKRFVEPKVTGDSLCDYETLRNAIRGFKKAHGLDEFNFKDMDKFFYLTAMNCFPFESSEKEEHHDL